MMKVILDESLSLSLRKTSKSVIKTTMEVIMMENNMETISGQPNETGPILPIPNPINASTPRETYAPTAITSPWAKLAKRMTL